jgi:hypothetical protein
MSKLAPAVFKLGKKSDFSLDLSLIRGNSKKDLNTPDPSVDSERSQEGTAWRGKESSEVLPEDDGGTSRRLLRRSPLEDSLSSFLNLHGGP